MRFIGAILLVLSIAAFVGGMFVVLGTDLLVEPLSSTLCEAPYFLERETFPNRNGSGTEIRYICVNDDFVEQKEVTGIMILGIFALAIPFTLSIVMITMGASRWRSGGQISIGANPGLDHLDAAYFDGLSERTETDSLREKLEQLKDAYDADLITAEEYLKSKQKILDDMVS